MVIVDNVIVTDEFINAAARNIVDLHCLACNPDMDIQRDIQKDGMD